MTVVNSRPLILAAHGSNHRLAPYIWLNLHDGKTRICSAGKRDAGSWKTSRASCGYRSTTSQKRCCAYDTMALTNRELADEHGRFSRKTPHSPGPSASTAPTARHAIPISVFREKRPRCGTEPSTHQTTSPIVLTAIITFIASSG